MDFLSLKEKAAPYVKRYRFVVLILLAGLLLMTLPQRQESNPLTAPVETVTEESLEAELAWILSRIRGAGKVEVLLTENAGAETLYQTDINEGNDTLREDTVVVSDSQRDEKGLIRQIIPPRYLGAVIVCQGGDNPGVKLQILDAVTKATGLKSNQISVLKMK